MLTDTQRKYLTELVGECWHTKHWKPRNSYPYDNHGKWICSKCRIDFGIINSDTEVNRTFTTPDDFFAVVRAIDYRDAAELLEKMQPEYFSNPPYKLVKAMQQPDFIERFMVEICSWGGIKE